MSARTSRILLLALALAGSSPCAGAQPEDDLPEDPADLYARLQADLRAEPDRIDVLARLAHLEIQMGRFEAARERSERLRKVAPNDPLGPYYEGHVALMLRKYELADEALREARRRLEGANWPELEKSVEGELDFLAREEARRERVSTARGTAMGWVVSGAVFWSCVVVAGLWLRNRNSLPDTAKRSS